MFGVFWSVALIFLFMAGFSGAFSGERKPMELLMNNEGQVSRSRPPGDDEKLSRVRELLEQISKLMAKPKCGMLEKEREVPVSDVRVRATGLK